MTLYIKGLMLEDTSSPVFTSQCTSSGYTLIYECTIVGGSGGATVWTGSALNCRSNEIILFHRRFTDSGGETIGSCNNGAIKGRSLSVEGNLYTSQLNVNITPDIAGKTIICVNDPQTGDPTDNMIQFSTTIPGITIIYS